MTLARLPKLGYNPSLFLGAVTSGEAAYQHIATAEGLGKKVFWCAWKLKPGEEKNSYLDGLGLTCVAPTRVADADFVLVQGDDVLGQGSGEEASSTFHDDGSWEKNAHFLSCLEAAARAGLPMVCANPDFRVLKPDGVSYSFQPGLVAEKYRELGGETVIFGKPEGPVFRSCFDLLQGECAEGEALDLASVVHVGDSLHHDVDGACRAGIDSILVTDHGVHRKRIGGRRGDDIVSEVADLAKECGVENPSVCVPSFVWEQA